MIRTLFERTAYFYNPVITQKTTYLACDFGNCICGKSIPEARIKSSDGFQKPHTSELEQIIGINPARRKSSDNTPYQCSVLRDQIFTGSLISALRSDDQSCLIAQVFCLPERRMEIRFVIVTVVPFPITERTFKESMKLSMMVNPIPLRSESPVVYIGTSA